MTNIVFFYYFRCRNQACQVSIIAIILNERAKENLKQNKNTEGSRHWIVRFAVGGDVCTLNKSFEPEKNSEIRESFNSTHHLLPLYTA